MKPSWNLLALLGFTLTVALNVTAQEPRSAHAAASLSAAEQEKLAALRKSYPLEVCVVSGDKLGAMGKPFDHLVPQRVNGKEEMRLVRFCCKGCLKEFNKDPEKYFKKIDAAAKASAASAAKP